MTLWHDIAKSPNTQTRWLIFHKKVVLEICQQGFTRATLMTFDSFNNIGADVRGERRAV